ncbi:MAG: hypothetical protein GY827_10805 [Cytophagales bacterium]|nr:hypothetical protein [Cytophagales bacterium]
MAKSNLIFAVRESFTTAKGPGDTFAITEDFELGQVVEITEPTSVVLKNNAQIERFEITATGGFVTILRRGLTQDDTITEDIALRKDWGD